LIVITVRILNSHLDRTKDIKYHVVDIRRLENRKPSIPHPISLVTPVSSSRTIDHRLNHPITRPLRFSLHYILESLEFSFPSPANRFLEDVTALVFPTQSICDVISSLDQPPYSRFFISSQLDLIVKIHSYLQNAIINITLFIHRERSSILLFFESN